MARDGDEEVAEDDDVMDEEVHSPVEEEEAEEAGDEDDEEEFPYDKMIEEMSLGDKEKFVVRLRQQLRTPKRAIRFVAELGELIDGRRAEDKDTVFEDFDISQNLIPPEQFEEMCSALADSRVQVERFRAFGSPGLDDQAALLLAGWLVAVSQEMAPFEMHLSDCAIQTEGFLELTKAFQENDAFPPKDPRFLEKGPIPLYLRLEGNYIDEAEIQAKVDDGTFMTMKKNDRLYYTSDHKAKLLVRDDGRLAQNKGEPPAPEDAPPPKRVHDKGKGKGKDKDKGKGKGKEKGKSRGKDKEKEAPWERDRRDGGKAKGRSAASALPARASWERERERPAPWSARSSARPVGASSSSYPSSRNAAGGSNRYSDTRYSDTRDSRGSSSRYGDDRGDSTRRRATTESSRNSDRPARTPAGSSAGGRPPLKRPLHRNGNADEAKRPRVEAAPSKRVLKDSQPTSSSRPSRREGGKSGGRSKENGKLPSPWEEHWSEEYGLHYFWNSKTGDSTWERPT
jgi:hypothetical protein